MTTPPIGTGPRPPRPTYRIPAKETSRLAGQWKALSALAKVGIVTGGVLTLGIAGAFANPLTSTPRPQVPKLANLSATASPPTAGAPSPSKVAATERPAAATPSASVTAPTTTAPAVTESVVSATQAATTAKTSTAIQTTSATQTTAAAKATTAAVQGAVTAGAFCSSGGATGVTSRGKPMICKTSATDIRLRWRAA